MHWKFKLTYSIIRRHNGISSHIKHKGNQMAITSFDQSRSFKSLPDKIRALMLATTHQMATEVFFTRAQAQSVSMERANFKKKIAKTITTAVAASAPVTNLDAWYETSSAFIDAMADVSKEKKSRKCLESLILMSDDKLHTTIIQSAYVLSVMFENAINSMQDEDIVKFAVSVCLRAAKYLVDKDLEFTLQNIIKGVFLGVSGRMQEQAKNSHLKSTQQNPDQTKTVEGVLLRSQPLLLQKGIYIPLVEPEHKYKPQSSLEKITRKVKNRRFVRYDENKHGRRKYPCFIATPSIIDLTSREFSYQLAEEKKLDDDALKASQAQRREEWASRTRVKWSKTKIISWGYFN
jgi:hypothetical protein